MFAIFRFTPVLCREGAVFLAPTVSLNDFILNEDSISGFYSPCSSISEYVFTSGFYDLKNDSGKEKKLICGHDGEFEEFPTPKPELFVLAPQYLDRNLIFSIRFLMRQYIDPVLLRQNIEFRYFPSDISSTFLAPNMGSLQELHSSTIEKISKRTTQLQNVLRECLFADIVEINKMFEEKKEELREFHKESRANSYDCAEQLGLDFLKHKKTKKFLRFATKTDTEEFKGIIVHLQTSETPCPSCATSLARSCEDSGIFREIFRNKPVLLVCTTPFHYRRSIDKAPYTNDMFIASAEPICFNLGHPHTLPFPIVLYSLDEETTTHYEIDSRQLHRALEETTRSAILASTLATE